MAAVSVCVPGELQLPPASLGASPRSASGLTQAPFKLLLLPWVPEHVGFCVCPLRVESLFPTALWVSQKKPCWPSKPNKYSGGSSSLSRTPGLGSPMLGLDPLFLRKNLCNILLFMRHPPGGVGLDYMAPPNPPISLWFLLCIFSCRRSFLVGSRFYHLCLLFWRVCERT